MTNEQLCIAIQNETGDKQKCLEELYTQNSGLIEKIINRYSGLEDPEDLRQEAYFGIVRAAEEWDPGKGACFATYAVLCIRVAVRSYIDNCGSVVRVPSCKNTLIRHYCKELNSYRVRYGRDPSDSELCCILGITPEQLKGLQNDAHALKIRSTSEIISADSNDLTLEDTIPAADNEIEDMIEKIQQEELSACIWSCVDTLRADQASVIRGKYKEGRTLTECGAALGLSVRRAGQIEQNALRELRKPKHSKMLRPYLTEQGAYSLGLRGNTAAMFERYGSSQERAMIHLEQQTGVSLWHGKELLYETSEQAQG